MNNLHENSVLKAAIAMSVVFHLILLLWPTIAPLALPNENIDQSLEIILVNAKHDRRPLNAQAYAQVNLDGGGENDAGRAKSPLPDMHKSENGENRILEQKRIRELEELQRQLIDQVRNETRFNSQRRLDKKEVEEIDPNANGRDLTDNKKAIARSIAEISQTIEDQNKRPRKTYLSPSTQGVAHALYYKAFQQKVEKLGTLNFPQHNGKKLYGEVIVHIPIFQDGTIYEKEGGPRIEKSSGNPLLDADALRIVRKSAPFGHVPPNMRSPDKDDVWIVTTKFKFTREQQLETEMRGRTHS